LPFRKASSTLTFALALIGFNLEKVLSSRSKLKEIQINQPLVFGTRLYLPE